MFLQLYVYGVLVGGLDIVKELKANGELNDVLKLKNNKDKDKEECLNDR